MMFALFTCSDCDETRSTVRCGTMAMSDDVIDDVISQCVDVRMWCDGTADCDDHSDETLCNTGQVKRSLIRSKFIIISIQV